VKPQDSIKDFMNVQRMELHGAQNQLDILRAELEKIKGFPPISADLPLSVQTYRLRNVFDAIHFWIELLLTTIDTAQSKLGIVVGKMAELEERIDEYQSRENK